jgi:hypothetical protein
MSANTSPQLRRYLRHPARRRDDARAHQHAISCPCVRRTPCNQPEGTRTQTDSLTTWRDQRTIQLELRVATPAPQRSATAAPRLAVAIPTASVAVARASAVSPALSGMRSFLTRPVKSWPRADSLCAGGGGQPLPSARVIRGTGTIPASDRGVAMHGPCAIENPEGAAAGRGRCRSPGMGRRGASPSPWRRRSSSKRAATRAVPWSTGTGSCVEPRICRSQRLHGQESFPRLEHQPSLQQARQAKHVATADAGRDRGHCGASPSPLPTAGVVDGRVRTTDRRGERGLPAAVRLRGRHAARRPADHAGRCDADGRTTKTSEDCLEGVRSGASGPVPQMAR